MTLPELTRKDILKATDLNRASEAKFMERHLPSFNRWLGREKDPVQNVIAVKEALEKLGISASEGAVEEAFTEARKALQGELDRAYQELETGLEEPLKKLYLSPAEFMGSNEQEQRETLKLLSPTDTEAIKDVVDSYGASINDTGFTLLKLVECAKKLQESNLSDTLRAELVVELKAATDRDKIEALSKKVDMRQKSQNSVEAAEMLTKSIEKTADLINPGTNLSIETDRGNLVVLDDNTGEALKTFMESRIKEPRDALTNAKSDFDSEQSEENLKKLEAATDAANKAFKEVKDVFKVVADGLKDYGKVGSNHKSFGTVGFRTTDTQFSKEYQRLEELGAVPVDLERFKKVGDKLADFYQTAVRTAVHRLTTDGGMMTAAELTAVLKPFERYKEGLFRTNTILAVADLNKLAGLEKVLSHATENLDPAVEKEINSQIEARAKVNLNEDEEMWNDFA